MLAELLPDESEVHGLLALMLLNDGRRTSRYRHGELVLLDDEERNPWDRERVAEGEQHLARARALYGRGVYVLRAEIASVHMAEPVDWSELVALYTELARLVPSGAVELNRAIAVAEVAAADCEAFWDNALDRIKAAAEAHEIEDVEAPAEDACAQRRRLPADAPDPAAHLEHVQPQLAKRERPPH